MLTLDTPKVKEIVNYEIMDIDINMVEGDVYVTLKGNTGTIEPPDILNLMFHIYDSFDNIILPSAWGETDPTGPEIYMLIQRYVYMRLQDEQGDNGLGAGVIT
jgi:hypothetical protein